MILLEWNSDWNYCVRSTAFSDRNLMRYTLLTNKSLYFSWQKKEMSAEFFQIEITIGKAVDVDKNDLKSFTKSNFFYLLFNRPDYLGHSLGQFWQISGVFLDFIKRSLLWNNENKSCLNNIMVIVIYFYFFTDRNSNVKPTWACQQQI